MTEWALQYYPLPSSKQPKRILLQGWVRSLACLDAKEAGFWLCCSASVSVSPPLSTLQRQASLRTLDEVFREFGGEVPIIREGVS
jgi:hypothetical protein